MRFDPGDGTENEVADVEIMRTETLSREEAARLLSTFATALGAMHVPDRLRVEVEVDVAGDEVGVEFALSWSHDERRGRRTETSAS